MNLIGEPLAFEFFRQGVIASGLVGALCGMLGVYIVLRRMSYIGHGLSHSVFGGAVNWRDWVTSPTRAVTLKLGWVS